MRKTLFAFLGLFLLSCGQKPGQVDVTLSLDGTVNQSAIIEFVFIVSNTGQSNRVLYPSECLGCTTSQSPCPSAQTCLVSTECGFTTNKKEFLPEIAFSDFAKDSSLSVTACALDSGKGVQGSGSGQVTNSSGQTLSITMNNSDTSCTTQLPTTCP
ncbi:MAG: hypothetical protein R3A11_01285 [Bdellovibrionota bacterium]